MINLVSRVPNQALTGDPEGAGTARRRSAGPLWRRARRPLPSGRRVARFRRARPPAEIWDFKEGKVVDTFTSDKGVPRHMAFDQTGRQLAVVTADGVLRVRDMDRKEWKTLAYQGVQWLNGFPAPGRLSTVATANAVTFWDVERGTELYHFTPGYGATGDWSADGGQLAWSEGSAVEVLPLNPQTWRRRACDLAARALTDGERELLPPGARSDACAAPEH